MKIFLKREGFGLTFYEEIDTEKDDMNKWQREETKAFLMSIVVIIAAFFIFWLLMTIIGWLMHEEKEYRPLVEYTITYINQFLC